MLNVTEFIFNSQGNATDALSYISSQGITDSTVFKSVSSFAFGDELLSFWGITRMGTIYACYQGFLGWVELISAFYAEKMDTTLVSTIGCVSGLVYLNTDLISAVVNGGTFPVKKIGYTNVAGVGEVFDTVQLETSGIKFGRLGSNSPISVSESVLEPKGFTSTKTVVVFNDHKRRVPNLYGIEATHNDGYEMYCLGTDTRPEDIVEAILSTDPGEKMTLKNGRTILCSSVSPESTVDGVIIPDNKEKGKGEHDPWSHKRALIKKVTSQSVDADSDVEENTFLRSLISNAALSLESDTEIDEEEEIINSQGLISKVRKPWGSSRVFADEEGAFKTTFQTNWFNSWGSSVYDNVTIGRALL